jgi:uncharacterized protein (DUF885 family)
MAGISQSLCIGLVFLALGSCGSRQSSSNAPAAGNSPNAKEQLNYLVDRYWDEHIPARMAISPQILADSLAVERRYLQELSAVPRDSLDAEARLTYDIFKRRRELLIEGFTYPAELMPLGALRAVLQSIEVLSADSSQRAWSVADYDYWLKRAAEYAMWSQQAVQNMHEGVRRGYVSPRFLIERSAALLDRPADDSSANVFRAPLRSMPDTIGEPDRTRLKNLLSDAVDHQLLPAIQALRDYLLHDYVTHGRAAIAVTDLPLGEKWYAYAIKRAGSSSLGADEIHALGVAEVERLHGRLPPEHEIATVPALSAPELLKLYEDLIPQVSTAMLPLFAEPPTAPLQVRGSEWLGDSRIALAYVPGGLLGKPAPVVYVNVGSAALRASHVSIPAFLQQVFPGHHLQSISAQASTDLPRFRRLEDDAGFVEGWQGYAASLGEQMSLLTDEASKTEAVLLQLRCAVGLVVDTGLHAKGWTRKQALEYLRAELGVDEAGAQSFVDFYSGNPADALACGLGELKFAGMRAKAQQTLGSRFDVKAFHAELLKDGAMPLDILEAKMKLWMDAAR